MADEEVKKAKRVRKSIGPAMLFWLIVLALAVVAGFSRKRLGIDTFFKKNLLVSKNIPTFGPKLRKLILKQHVL